MKKILLFISVLIVSIFTLNIRLFASNSYYLMSCVEQNIPTGYYDSVNTSSESAIRQSLCNIISANFVENTYDTASDIDNYADADPYNEGMVTCIYTGQSIKNNLHGTQGWDKEHIWCKSHGFKAMKADGKTEWTLAGQHAYNDCHHLRAAEHITNIYRSDKDFGEVENPTGTNEYGCKWTDTIFEPRDEVKGDVARMLFYMMVRYGEFSTDTFKTVIDGTETQVAYNLQLVDDDTTTTSTGNGRLGKLSTLLKWHYQDPVSNTEIYRNNVVYQFQSNRNPFIDHPEYVDIAFENAIGSYTEPSQPADPREPDTVIRTEELCQEIGFEAAEEFKATDTYNGHYLSGIEDQQWGAFYGTVSTADAISGSQSMQMRWYKKTPDLNPMCFMNYDVNNLSKIEFSAKGIANSKIEVLYSYDQGLTWLSNEIININGSKKTYSSTISSNGGYGDLRVCLKVILPDTKPTSTKYFFIDDVKIYRCKDDGGSEFTKASTKANLNFKYNESSFVNTETYFTKVTSISEIEDGSEFIIAANDCANNSYALNSYDSNNQRYAATSVTTRNGRVYLDNANTFTLETGANEGTYALNFGGKYLGNTDTNKKICLNPFDEITINTSWTITIDSNGLASIVLVGEGNANQRKVLSFKNTNTNQYFACYTEKQTDDVALYKKVTSDVTNKEYTFNETYLRFGGIITKALYQDILAEDSNATFGIALSKDGSTYTPYECTVTLANLVEGKLVDNVNGDYAYFAVKVLTPKEHFNDTVYAKAYVIVNGETFYMQESSHSVTELVNYYLNNVTLTDDETDLLGGLIQ